MTTMFQKRRRLLILATLAVCTGALTISACSDSNDGSEGLGAGGGITIALSPTELTLPAGTSGTVEVTVGRTGAFTGAVTLKTGGEPEGVSVGLSPVVVDAGATSSTATITVGDATLPGTYHVGIAGTASLISTGQAGITLVVTPGEAPPAGAR
jgi:hypothetical protein